MMDAANLIRTGASPELADQMALALRHVGNILDQQERFAAYFRAGVDLINTSVKEQYAADEVALSIEIMIRDAGHQ